jgi:hypothetical protein
MAQTGGFETVHYTEMRQDRLQKGERDKGKSRKLETTVQDADRRQDQVKTGEPETLQAADRGDKISYRQERKDSRSTQHRRQAGASQGRCNQAVQYNKYRAVNGVPKL